MTRTDMLCAGLRYSGLLAWRARRASPSCLRILAYHRVVPSMSGDHPFDADVLSCTRDEFVREMRFVKKHFEVLTFADLAPGKSFTRSPLIITFDDGYKDNRDVALPVLEDLEMKAVFFVSTGYIGSGQAPWWDEVAWIVKRCTGKHLAACMGGATRAISVADEGARASAICSLLGEAKRLPNRGRLALLSELRGQAAPCPGEALMMSWDDVRHMAARGMEIGSHTVTHPLLDRLESPEELAAELRESKLRIELETGRPVTALSYPVGRTSGVTEALARQVTEAGYRYGCVYEHGVNEWASMDPLRLRRIKAEVGDDFTRFRAKVLFPAWVRY